MTTTASPSSSRRACGCSGCAGHGADQVYASVEGRAHDVAVPAPTLPGLAGRIEAACRAAARDGLGTDLDANGANRPWSGFVAVGDGGDADRLFGRAAFWTPAMPARPWRRSSPCRSAAGMHALAAQMFQDDLASARVLIRAGFASRAMAVRRWHAARWCRRSLPPRPRARLTRMSAMKSLDLRRGPLRRHQRPRLRSSGAKWSVEQQQRRQQQGSNISTRRWKNWTRDRLPLQQHFFARDGRPAHARRHGESTTTWCCNRSSDPRRTRSADHRPDPGPGDGVLLAQGGDGGWGGLRFKSSTDQRRATPIPRRRRRPAALRSAES